MPCFTVARSSGVRMTPGESAARPTITTSPALSSLIYGRHLHEFAVASLRPEFTPRSTSISVTCYIVRNTTAFAHRPHENGSKHSFLLSPPPPEGHFFFKNVNMGLMSVFVIMRQRDDCVKIAPCLMNRHDKKTRRGGRPHQQSHKCLDSNSSSILVPDWGLTLNQTGRLAVGINADWERTCGTVVLS